MKDWCRHFNGITSLVCKAGVSYSEVRLDTPGRYPCNQPGVDTCALRVYFTEEELHQQGQALAEYVRKVEAFSSGTTRNCPRCEREVVRLRKVGRCVYCRPCGCRLWQGQIPPAWR